ncbi:hypothetical protein TSH7_09870 [Azospirillum sp. TSH7]|uniref:hypothetical protein n=1 Tax=unclassified Azospirillum TaxID=2630922 RepID=UPI000D604AF8|nr:MULTISPECIES: hypothetical protein [unclassified Azospirillum]PWC63977.1 hypothetical protein TSH20_18965 [Azospirillum sp. TSH20]PWC64840.1 hypothetical protein TSH7_09870 [Azospirillum sp. TSH7]
MGVNAAQEAGGNTPAFPLTLDEQVTLGYASLPQRTPRAYIGASIVGDPCEALLALSLRGFPDDPPAGRQLRIFRDGHRIEDDVLFDLRLAGIPVQAVDPATGEQWEWKLYGGHVVSHADGKVEWEERLRVLEVKSMNKDRARRAESKGVRVSDPKYYAQMQFLMGMSGIPSCLFVVYCKDNSRYNPAEVVEFDPFFYAALLAKVERALSNEAVRLGATPEAWTCELCFKRSSCWTPPAIAPDCAKCADAVPVVDGDRQWWCNRHDREAVKPCEAWTLYRPRNRT